MFKRLIALFRQKDSIVWEREWWKRRAIINEEHVDYWQQSSKWYKGKWDEALSFLPKEKAEELTNPPDGPDKAIN